MLKCKKIAINMQNFNKICKMKLGSYLFYRKFSEMKQELKYTLNRVKKKKKKVFSY